MTLNPQVVALLEYFAQVPAPKFPDATPAEVRAMGDVPMAVGEPPKVARVEEIEIELPGRTVAARLYVPDTGSSPAPLTVFFHGGGWVIGTLDTHDATCRALANASGSAVLSVAYRLAPEHPFPAPLEDCYEALRWASLQGATLGVDVTQLAVAGDSAGGNLAAAVSILARDRGGPQLRHQLLIYPVTDADFSRASYLTNGVPGSFLTTEMMKWFWGHYLGEADPGETPLAAVIRTPDLSNLPSATVITAEYDPLCDEGEAYAKRLAEAGTKAEYLMAPGMIHGFASMFQAVPDALPWIDRIGILLGAALGGQK